MLHTQYIDTESEALGGSDFWVFCSFFATMSKVSTLLLNLVFLPWFCTQSIGPQTGTQRQHSLERWVLCWRYFLNPSLPVVHRKVEILPINSVFGSICQTLSSAMYDDWAQGWFCTRWGFGFFSAVRLFIGRRTLSKKSLWDYSTA